MWLTVVTAFTAVSSVELRGNGARAAGFLYCATLFAVDRLRLPSRSRAPARAQQANQPGFDPRQTEKHFDDLAIRPGGSRPSRRCACRSLARPEVSADSKPLVRASRRSRVVGAIGDAARAIWRQPISPISARRSRRPTSPRSRKPISDLYRAAGFHLSRAIIPPQDIEDGRVRIQVIEGSITEVALKGDGAEQFGVRPMLEPVLAEHPSRLATLERQLLLINGRPGVRITDSALEEIGGATGRFRLVVYLKTWHVYTCVRPRQSRLVVGRAVADLRDRRVQFLSARRATRWRSICRPSPTIRASSASAGCPMTRRSAPTARGSAPRRSTARSGRATARRLFNDITTTEAFEVHGSIVPVQSQRRR